MAGPFESLSTINSFIRTLLALAVTGGVGYGGWYGYRVYNKAEIEAQRAGQDLEAAQLKLESTEQELGSVRRTVTLQQAELTQQGQRLKAQDIEIGNLKTEVAQQAEHIEQLATSLRLLKVDHRVARLTALDVGVDPDSGDLASVVEFTEFNDSGDAIGKPKHYKIRGDVVYIDNWVVKFDDKYVEQADIDRSTSLVLFRRIFGEFQEPNQGFPIDEVGSSPLVYSRGGQSTELEKKIWGDFWNIANDRIRAKQMGIRAAHGEAVSIKLQKGKSYRLQLRASDGLSIQPDEGSRQPTPARRPAT